MFSGTIEFSTNATERPSGRRLTQRQFALRFDFGRRIYGTSAELYFLGRRDMLPFLAPRDAERLDGTVAVSGIDASVIAMYRNDNAIRKI